MLKENISTAEIVEGVMELFPGADRQALTCLSELLVKRVSELPARAEAAEAEVERIKSFIKSCQWYWPADNTSSEACADGPQEVLESAYGWSEPTGEVCAVARGGIVEVTYCAALPPAADATDDDWFWVEELTEADAKAKIDAERLRRVSLHTQEG